MFEMRLFNVISLTLLVCFVGSCGGGGGSKFRKKGVDNGNNNPFEPNPNPNNPIPNPNPTNPEVPLQHAHPFMTLLRSSRHPSLGDANQAARKLLGFRDISSAVDDDQAAFTLRVGFFLNERKQQVVDMEAKVKLVDSVASKKFTQPLKIDNGCARLIQTGVISPDHPNPGRRNLFALCQQFGVEPFPTVFFPFDGQFNQGGIYAVAGAIPQTGDVQLTDRDPFHGANGIAHAGVLVITNVDPRALKDARQRVSEYLSALSMRNTPECIDSLMKDPNFIFIFIDAIRFRKEERPDLTPPFSPILCKDTIDFVTIAKNRLYILRDKRGCRHPNANCGQSRKVGPCENSKHFHFDEVDNDSLMNAFVVPVMMVFDPATSVWFPADLDTIPNPQCGVSQGKFPQMTRGPGK